MANVSEVLTSIERTVELSSHCAETETSDSYDGLGAAVATLSEQAHQAMKSQLDIASLLAKLKEQKPLGPDELKTLEFLIVGDAEYFLKYEADLDRWREEAKQLIAEIAKLQSAPLNVDSLMHLRALCQELQRVLPNIVYYLDQKERTTKFHQATKGPIDEEGYRVLALMVTAMISSDRL
jgi:hypothetical protein